MTLVQSSIFDFKPLPRAPPSARWILGWKGQGHAQICSTDAAAMAGSVGRIPTDGMWLRCLPIDKGASYNGYCREWDSKIWWHNSGLRYEKLVRYDGSVLDLLWPGSVRYDRKRDDAPKLEVLDIRIDEGVLAFLTEDGEWCAEICPDSQIRQWDRHPYRPTYDLEHFAIECHRHRIPEDMMAWRAHRVWATEGLRPFFETPDHPAVYRADRMGRVDWAIVPNEDYAQIVEVATGMGLALELRHIVPALDNLAMWPAEHVCESCLRKGRSNKEACWRSHSAGCCSEWIWDRQTPAKGLRAKKSECLCEEDFA